MKEPFINRLLTALAQAREWREKEVDVLKKGMRVVEPTKKVGQVSRRGVVVEVDHQTVEVRWDDGHTSDRRRADAREESREVDVID